MLRFAPPPSLLAKQKYGLADLDITRDKGSIKVVGNFDKFPIFLSYIHTAINKAGFSEIVLDFSECDSAFQNAMLSVCAQIMAYRKAGIYFTLVPPNKIELFNLFKNTGWAHFIDPRMFDPPFIADIRQEYP